MKGPAGFWDEFAPWYEQWISRGAYHQPLIRVVSTMLEPGWNILDIGAATGVLSIPLASLGCTLTAMKLSRGMVDIFRSKLMDLHVPNINILKKRWEDVSLDGTPSFDCVIACNSLHLCEGGIAGGMKKVFTLETGSICLITEINQGLYIDFKDIDSMQDRFDFLFIRDFRVDSSFYFQSMEEVYAVEELLRRKMDITIENGKPVQHDNADITVVWWERKR